MTRYPTAPSQADADKAMAEMTEASRLGTPSLRQAPDLPAAAQRQMERVYAQVHAIRDDVQAGEFDGARSHLEILKRQLADLDEKLLVAALAPEKE